ncbi:superoxide dismutase family protein [Candidatus Woesearchaeota archaeon]|nr:superoxide dismutase family protein [Candidatus Woesearchaeota archaeon]
MKALLVAVLFLFLISCYQPKELLIVLKPTDNFHVSGTVIFKEENKGVRVIADLNNLQPGPHGIHIHEFGSCDNNAEKAGGHLNPVYSKHGSPENKEHHVGDLGNIDANNKGHAQMDKVFTYLSFSGVNSIIGRAIVVHAKQDDFVSQPSGNSGEAVACGTIV